ncbi:hypothetical protein FRC00_002352 [Tulasnella sp. 408]|nr:hypothetical protein FRC00_002352 [Tulasnella sp. 408]
MPSTRAQAAQHRVTNTNPSADPEGPGRLWHSRRDPRDGDDRTRSTSKQRRGNKRERSASPEPPTASATTSTSNKRRRSNRLQATKAEKEKPIIKLQPAPLVAPKARGPSRSTTAKAPARGQVVRSRQKKEAPQG